MTPVIKTKPTQGFYLRVDGTTVEVIADTIDEPDRRDEFYTLELEGEIVAKFRRDSVHGWWIDGKRG